MLKTAFCAGAFAVALAGVAVARPAPVIQSASPDTLPAGAGSADVTIYGQNFFPYSDGMDGFDPSEIMHIFLRVVPANGPPGPWTRCDDGASGCSWSYSDFLSFHLDHGWLVQPNAQVQIHFFTGHGMANITDPSQVATDAGDNAADWSNIFSVPVRVAPMRTIQAPHPGYVPPQGAPQPMQQSLSSQMRAPMQPPGGWPSVTIVCASTPLLTAPGGAPAMAGGRPVVVVKGETFNLIASEGALWRKLQHGLLSGWVDAACVR